MTSLDHIASIFAFARKLFSLQTAELYLLVFPEALRLAKLLQILNR